MKLEPVATNGKRAWMQSKLDSFQGPAFGGETLEVSYHKALSFRVPHGFG